MADTANTALIPTQCAQCAVRSRAICGALNEDEIVSLNQIAHKRSYEAGEVIMSDEEPHQFYANILSGVIKLTKGLSDGRQQIVGLRFAPDFLGRAFGPQIPFFAEAATDVEICMFPRDGFEKILKKYPELEHRLFERTLDELDAARDWMLLLGRKTAREKVASFLLTLAERAQDVGCHHYDFDADKKVSFELPLTRADMADFLGLTIETVSRQITHLKTSSIIRLVDNRLFVVEDLEGLDVAAGNERLNFD